MLGAAGQYEARKCESRAPETHAGAMSLSCALALLGAGCSGVGETSHEMSVVAAPAPFVQRIQGTTVTLDMTPVAGDGGAAPLWMSRTEITWDLYDVFLFGLDGESGDEADGVSRPSKPYVPPDRGFGHAGYPAMGMTFHAAEAFCHWLTVRTGRNYRLPTEAEWSAACAAGGAANGGLGDQAWFAANAGRTTHPVATRQANALLLHDMLGNVAEWARGTDGRPVACGGSYLDDGADLGCAARQRQHADWNESDPQIPKSRWWLADCSFVGFRVVCDGEDTAAGSRR